MRSGTVLARRHERAKKQAVADKSNHGVEQASAEIGESFRAGSDGRSRATSEVDKKGKGTLCRFDLLTLPLNEAHNSNAQGVNGFLGSYVVSSSFSPRVLARSLLENT